MAKNVTSKLSIIANCFLNSNTFLFSCLDYQEWSIDTLSAIRQKINFYQYTFPPHASFHFSSSYCTQLRTGILVKLQQPKNAECPLSVRFPRSFCRRNMGNGTRQYRFCNYNLFFNIPWSNNRRYIHSIAVSRIK